MLGYCCGVRDLSLPVPHNFAGVLLAELNPVRHDGLEEVLLLPPRPFLLLLLILLFLSLSHDVLDMLPLLVPLLEGHSSGLLLLELPLIGGDQLPQPGVERRAVWEWLQTARNLLLLVDWRGGSGRSGRGTVVIIIQTVVSRLGQIVQLSLKGLATFQSILSIFIISIMYSTAVLSLLFQVNPDECFYFYFYNSITLDFNLSGQCDIYCDIFIRSLLVTTRLEIL